MLVRPGQPFAVFYTEVGLADGIRDVPSSTAPNYDLDTDHVPDYAERIYSCLQAAQTRYKAYYNLAPAVEQSYFGWLKLDYSDPLTPTTQLHGAFYPVIIRDEPHRGQVLPFLAPLQNGPYPATFMNIDHKAAGVLQRDSGTWLYPGLENTVYHEMAHAYQGIYKSIANPFDWLDN